jgi:bleomycin hydrolase
VRQKYRAIKLILPSGKSLFIDLDMIITSHRRNIPIVKTAEIVYPSTNGIDQHGMMEACVRRTVCFLLMGAAIGIMALSATAQTDKVKYVPHMPYPLFERLDKEADSIKAIGDSATAAIRERQKKAKEEAKKNHKDLRFDFSKVVKPSSPEAFKSAFYFPPVAQENSSTCWSFSSTSFVESEIYRLTGRKIKLSEMYTVYHEYILKLTRFIRERGDSRFGPGSEGNAIMRIMPQYGAVPEEVYPGWTLPDKHHNHGALETETEAYLDYIKSHNYWDEDQDIAGLKMILDKYLGKPPESFVFEGKTMTPQEFYKEVVKIHPADYVIIMSTSSKPFYTQALFDVYDNWWNDSSYYNVPLDEWYGILKNAVKQGMTVEIGGDNSEPGYFGPENAAVIPDFDIPQNYINQDSREFRMNNSTTGDDHGLHVVGYAQAAGHDWYLIKDSGSGSRKGKFNGFLFFRDDYIRLKMMTIMVHKDAAGEMLKKFKAN